VYFKSFPEEIVSKEDSSKKSTEDKRRQESQETGHAIFPKIGNIDIDLVHVEKTKVSAVTQEHQDHYKADQAAQITHTWILPMDTKKKRAS
jgi:hypothetical protein